MRPAPPAEILAFWEQAGPARWFSSDPRFDAEIAMRFAEDVARACKKLSQGPHPWEQSARSALALLILTDQFPRNIYRGLVDSWACDPHALAAAKRAISARQDREIKGQMRIFFYLPFTHSENAADQDRCVELVAAAFGPDSGFARHARAHRAIIGKFGRFPARNAVLGRPSSFVERDWLRGGGYAQELEPAAEAAPGPAPEAPPPMEAAAP